MKLHVLGSSSNGNGYLLRAETSGEVLALEAGVDFKKVLKAVNFNTQCIAGCLITHEHGDHAACAHHFAERCIAVYASEGTVQALQKRHSPSPFYKSIKPQNATQIGKFKVIPFPVQHDAEEPFGFLIKHRECGTVLFATDTYFLKYTFPPLNQVMLECNYHTDVLKECFMQGRIHKARYERTLRSHMSYENCLRTLLANRLELAQNIVLLHLSQTHSRVAEFRQGIQALFPHSSVAVAEPGLTLDFNQSPF